MDFYLFTPHRNSTLAFARSKLADSVAAEHAKEFALTAVFATISTAAATVSTNISKESVNVTNVLGLIEIDATAGDALLAASLAGISVFVADEFLNNLSLRFINLVS